MKIKLSINYTTNWGESVWVCGSIPELGNGNEENAKRMDYISPTEWSVIIDVSKAAKIKYTYHIRKDERIIKKEVNPHFLAVDIKNNFIIADLWNDEPEQKYLYSSVFKNSFFKQSYSKPITEYPDKTSILNIKCPYVKKDERLILIGSSIALGKWNLPYALQFTPIEYGLWQLVINGSQLDVYQEYKLAIQNTITGEITHWEEGANRTLNPNPDAKNTVRIKTLAYRYGKMHWKAAGVCIPIFSLRSEDSFGIGEFSDLKKMVDWAEKTEQKIIQILPINDTTSSYKWTDSYPYNSISIYALHPIYLGLKEFPLKDKAKLNLYLEEADDLNKMDKLNYEKVYKLKKRYLKDLFKESGETVLKTKGFKTFFKENEEWLFPYACFSYLRDKNKTADHSAWGEYSLYDEDALKTLVQKNTKIKDSINRTYFIQYLLHIQLLDAKKYANKKGVVLKGDIPIGISRKSVEAWTEPHLFNLDVQTGAPPDAFSTLGQNWGFPTYNWAEMAKDGYLWWKKRFKKMADYFDAYRIDHILGFFRIWEIPMTSIQGLLGYFSPALPYSADDLIYSGIPFDENRMMKPYLRKDYLDEIFGKRVDEAIDKYLDEKGDGLYELKDFCNNQLKIQKLFKEEDDKENLLLRSELYLLCNNVLFVKDKYNPDKYHPRIEAYLNYSFNSLDNQSKENYYRLYDDFFHYRHNQYWREQAMIKLPELISATDMLVCGEDLGMVPDSVPSVMQELQILSLKVERFSGLSNLPYESVCTTSTHDMSTIREWWNENRDETQKYYNEILNREGIAPDDCSGDICTQIVANHLQTSSMLVILPLQDWLSIDGEIRRENPKSERINVPSESRHYWRYRMHLTLEELLEAKNINEKVKELITSSDRG